MATSLKLIAIGNSTGVILPKEMLDRLHLQKGDRLHVIEAPDGYKVIPYVESLDGQLDVAEKVMREDRDILRKLAE